MILRCPRCHSEYIALPNSRGREHCCITKNEISKLGLHPALAKQLGKRQKISNVESISKNPRKEGNYTILPDSGANPKVFGYEMCYQVGKGAMGSVYKARQINTGKLVAIKILGKDLSLRSDLVARFEREAYALKALKHDNVVSIVDSGQVDDTHFFAMEFIDGITLRARLGHTSFSLEEACFITEQILHGLSAAHDLGIIHRDLKPENVLLAYSSADIRQIPMRVVLVDFGLVGIGGLAFDPHPNLTRSKVTMGTVNYMAPEQHIDAKRVDHRSDLYSSGVILFEMLTNELPLGRYILPHERGMPVPPMIDKILSKALSRNLEERYLNAGDFLKDLKDFKEALQKSKSPSDDKIIYISDVKQNIWKKIRYHLLIIISFVFFGLGLKLSYAKNPSIAKTMEAGSKRT